MGFSAKSLTETLKLNLPIILLAIPVTVTLLCSSLLVAYAVDDASEVFLSIAKCIVECDGIPNKTPKLMFSGEVISLPPGISLLFAYTFTILSIPPSANPPKPWFKLADPFTLLNAPSILEVTFILCLSAVAYALSRKCNLSKAWSSLSALLVMTLPYWIFYFKVIPRYADLGGAFMTSASIYLTLILAKNKLNSTKATLLWLAMMATTSSKYQCLIAPIVVFILTLKMSELWDKYKLPISTTILGAYLALALTLCPKMYLPMSLIWGSNVTALLAIISIIPFASILRLKLRDYERITLKNFLKFLIVLLASTLWYLRTWLVTGSPIFTVVKSGDAAWAGEIIAKSIAMGGWKPIFTLVPTMLFNTFPVSFTIPFIIGFKCLHNSKNLFHKGAEIWLLTGLTAFIGVFQLEDVRYILYFMLPFFVTTCIGISKIVGKHVSPEYDMAVALIISLLSIALLIEAPYPTTIQSILFPTSTLIWIYMTGVITPLNQLTKALRCKPKIDSKTKKILITAALIVVILLAWVSTYVNLVKSTRRYNELKRVRTFYKHVKSEVGGNLTVTFGHPGIYYYADCNAINIIYPEHLALLKPLVESRDIQSGIDFLVRNLGVKYIILPAEQNYVWHSWYCVLLEELPELRALHNPHVSSVVYRDNWTTPWFGWYILKLTGEHIDSCGVLDVVAGRNSKEEISLFLACNHTDHIPITRKSDFKHSNPNTINITVFLYFPYQLTGKRALIDTYVNLTVVRDGEHLPPSTVTQRVNVSLSKVVNFTIAELIGYNKAAYTLVSIQEIKITVYIESKNPIVFILKPVGGNGANFWYWGMNSPKHKQFTWTYNCTGLSLLYVGT